MADPILDQEAVAGLLTESLRTIEWAVGLVPRDWTHQIPDNVPPDSWTVAMNVAHLVTYERCIGLPLLEDLAAGGDGSKAIESPFEQSFLADAERIAGEPIDELLSQFRTLREREVLLVQAFDPARFNEATTEAFNWAIHGSRKHSAAFIAAKSFQHTWEHGNAIVRAMLFSPG